MRVRSRLNSKKNTRPLRVALVALLLVGTGMLLPKLYAGVAAAVLAPVHGVNRWLDESSSFIPTLVRDREALQLEIETLTNQVVTLQAEDLTEQRLREENERLRSLLGATEEVRTVAAVIARPGELPYDLLQIDQGSEAGIVVGAPVFVGEDRVIGVVSHVAPLYSFVQLITSPAFQATAFVSGPDIVVRMEGLGGGVARVLVPQGIDMTVGDLVFLPSVVPGVFGHISYIESQPTQPEQFGYVVPDISLTGLYYVAVGTPAQVIHDPNVVDERILEVMRSQLVVEGVSVGVSAVATSTATSSATTSRNEI